MNLGPLTEQLRYEADRLERLKLWQIQQGDLTGVVVRLRVIADHVSRLEDDARQGVVCVLCARCREVDCNCHYGIARGQAPYIAGPEAGED